MAWPFCDLIFKGVIYLLFRRAFGHPDAPRILVEGWALVRGAEGSGVGQPQWHLNKYFG